MQIPQSRRRFLIGLSLSGVAGIIAAPRSAHAEPPPETTSVRLPQWIGEGYCWAAPYIAGELLRAEGLTDVRYVQGDTNLDNSEWLARGDTDFDINMPPMHIAMINDGAPINVLAGLHSGCFELIANDRIHDLTDLRGMKVGVWALNSHPHVLVSLMAAYVGLDPKREIQWITPSDGSTVDLFVGGKVDAILAAEPESKLRAKQVGHTIVDNNVDRPWSEYFCCMIAGSDTRWQPSGS
jgi:NitT/TauT family transport system substrate-binding protein